MVVVDRVSAASECGYWVQQSRGFNVRENRNVLRDHFVTESTNTYSQSQLAAHRSFHGCADTGESVE